MDFKIHVCIFKNSMKCFFKDIRYKLSEYLRFLTIKKKSQNKLF